MVQTTEAIAAKLAFLPEEPGIYLWKDKEGRIIYVGKALNLAKRIKSYLVNTQKDDKTELLVRNIADLYYIISLSENEAFILEADLIKTYKPKYNIMLRDDKSYPFVKVTLQEPFPRIMITRERVKDGSIYYGPYTDVRDLRRVMRTFEWIFPLRTCSRKIPLDRIAFSKACINLQLGKCLGPCIGRISHPEYCKVVQDYQKIFLGKHQEIMDDFRATMNALSEELSFELAAKYRDRILAIERIQKRQSVFYPDGRSMDILGFYSEENTAIIVVLKMVNGKIINQENYPLTNTEHSPSEEILAAFLKLYYAHKDELPDEILLPLVPVDFEQLNIWLKKKLFYPQKGEKTKLIVMAKRNAFHLVEEKKLSHLRKANRTIFPIQELKEKLNLNKLPRKIVCMDISTIQGTDTVSSAVWYENGKAKKKYYRHFIIHSIDSQNDFAAMAETLERFLKEVDKDPLMKPDLIIVDGGKGQLSSALGILKASSHPDLPLISLAKRIEEIFTPESSEPLILPKSSSALRLITSIRDEAHRFAINFHRSRRSKRTLISELEDIPGIGEQTKFLLLKELGSVEAVRLASIEEIARIKNIGPKTATQIYQFFHPDQNTDT
ncbi:MAG: excinuclease ABC subunit UvrC [Candidatus Cloacimonetes bacterium]|nr:excinuclease ABC subunit UvrC [Candidatus Cloacimonadota bacterium]